MENSVYSVLENRYFKNKIEHEIMMMMEGFRLCLNIQMMNMNVLWLSSPLSAHPHHHLWLLTVSVC